MNFYNRHKEAIWIIIIGLIIAIVASVYDLYYEKSMRNDAIEDLNKISTIYESLKNEDADVSMSELYEAYITYHNKVYKWYNFCEEHQLLSSSNERTESWMSLGFADTAMQNIFVDMIESENYTTKDIFKSADDDLKTIEYAVEYLEIGEFDITTFDSYCKKMNIEANEKEHQ